jgi:uncharacterized protein
MSDSLKINLAILPEDGLRLRFSEGNAWFQGCFAGDAPPEFSLVSADADCLITRSGDTIYVSGDLSAQMSRECSRCLEPATISAGGAFAYTLVPEKTETAQDLELSAEELETGCYRGDFIDLAPIICEQIVLVAPMKFLCAENCRGLCPHCGVNLNTGSCSCRSETVDDRLAALKKFTVKK